jgi:hypothetical protein
MRKANLRVISLVLILIFTQKLGLGLWLHNWLHEPRSSQSTTIRNNAGPFVELPPVKCNCIEDAIMPLVESKPFVYLAYQQYLLVLHGNAYSDVLSQEKVFSALRGPPSGIGLS